MDSVCDVAALRKRVLTVCRGRGYTSNLYVGDEQLTRWVSRGAISAIEGDGAVLTLLRERDFYRLYHTAESPAALARTLAQLPPGTFVADLIGQGDALESLCEIYGASDFVAHDFLRRMVRVQAPETPSSGEATVATAADARAVAALLDRLLDPLTEPIPTEAELAEEAEAGRLLLTRDEHGAVTGMLLYDLKAAAAQLRLWHVDSQARGQGVGRRLMAGFLARCAAARRLVLWVIGDNARSIAIYEHYGFAADGLLDRIMVLRKEARA